MGTYTDIDHEALRQAIANRAYSKGGIAIDATPADVETTAAVIYSINGVMYSLAIQAAIDLSALGILTEPGTTPAATTALARTQEDQKDRVYLLVVDAAGTISIVPGMAVDAGKPCPSPRTPPDHCAFAAVKVVNASGSAFIFGTTSLATAGVTDTYFDVTMSPFPL